MSDTVGIVGQHECSLSRNALQNIGADVDYPNMGIGKPYRLGNRVLFI